MRPSDARRSGFTLSELLVVLVIVGLLGLVAIPNIEVVRFRMDGSVRGVVGAMVAAQRVAVKRQHDVVVVFDTAKRQLRVHEDADNDGVVDAGERVRPVSLGEEVIFGLGPAPARPGYTGTVSWTEKVDGLPVVRFLRNGSASEQGNVYITSTRSVRGEEYAKDTRAVEVERPTGRVTWHHYDPPEWKQGF